MLQLFPGLTYSVTQCLGQSLVLCHFSYRKDLRRKFPTLLLKETLIYWNSGCCIGFIHLILPRPLSDPRAYIRNDNSSRVPQESSCELLWQDLSAPTPKFSNLVIDKAWIKVCIVSSTKGMWCCILLVRHMLASGTHIAHNPNLLLTNAYFFKLSNSTSTG